MPACPVLSHLTMLSACPSQLHLPPHCTIRASTPGLGHLLHHHAAGLPPPASITHPPLVLAHSALSMISCTPLSLPCLPPLFPDLHFPQGALFCSLIQAALVLRIPPTPSACCLRSCRLLGSAHSCSPERLFLGKGTFPHGSSWESRGAGRRRQRARWSRWGREMGLNPPSPPQQEDGGVGR